MFGRAQRTAKLAAAVTLAWPPVWRTRAGQLHAEGLRDMTAPLRGLQDAEEAADEAPKPVKGLFGGARRTAKSAVTVRRVKAPQPARTFACL